MIVVYNPNGTIGNLWELIRNYEGNGQITFSINDSGQVQYSTVALSGSNHQGIISFSAQALTQV